MRLILLYCALLVASLMAASFWEAKAPHDWTDAELSQMLNDSPWARAAVVEGIAQQPGVETYLSSALPMQEAEAEVTRRRRLRNRQTEPLETSEYREFLKEKKGESIVLTILFPDPSQLADGKESKRMEEESVMKIGRKKYKMTGHFPPVPDDPFLRLVFPRAVGPKDKIVEFDLYLPGVTEPYRTAEYDIKGMMFRGKFEM